MRHVATSIAILAIAFSAHAQGRKSDPNFGRRDGLLMPGAIARDGTRGIVTQATVGKHWYVMTASPTTLHLSDGTLSSGYVIDLVLALDQKRLDSTLAGDSLTVHFDVVYTGKSERLPDRFSFTADELPATSTRRKLRSIPLQVARLYVSEDSNTCPLWASLASRASIVTVRVTGGAAGLSHARRMTQRERAALLRVLMLSSPRSR